MTKRDTSDTVTTGTVYDVYKAWCKDNYRGCFKTQKEFRETISSYLRAPYSELIDHSKNGSIYREYTLSKDVKEHYLRKT